MRRAILLALLSPAACATPGAEAEAPPAAYEAIAFEINSWGRPLGSWQVGADGSVRHLEVVGSPVGAHRREHREFAVDAAAYAELAALAARVPTPRPSREDCEERATDLPYGTLRLTGPAGEEAVPFDTGCLDKPYQVFVGRLRAMDDFVGGWAEGRPATRVEEVGGN